MSGTDIAVIVIVSLAVLGAVGYIIYRKIKHKGGCDCGCGCGCAGCSGCKIDRDSKENK